MSTCTTTAPPRPQTNIIALTLLFTGFLAATYGFGIYLFPALMPDMQAGLALSYQDSGLIMAASQMGFLVAALISGWIIAKIGPVRLIILSVTCCLAALVLIPFASGVAYLCAAFFVTGAASATVWVPMAVIAKNMIPQHHQGKALGVMSSATAYGVLINGTAISLLVPTYGWRSVWFFAATLTCILLLWGRFFLSGLTKNINSPHTEPYAHPKTGTLPPSSFMVPLIMFFSGLTCMPAQNYLISFVRDELHHSLQAAGYIWNIMGMIGMTGGFVMGGLADKITVKRALVLSYLILAASMAAFINHHNIMIIYPGHLTAAIFGLGNVMLGLGAMAGNFMGGHIKNAAGSFQPVYMGAFALCMVLTLLAACLKRPSPS